MPRSDDAIAPPSMAGIVVENDTPEFDQTGYDNIEFKKNGEFNVISKIVQQRQSMVIFDVGANKGDWSKLV